jgi:hypothetical protein
LKQIDEYLGSSSAQGQSESIDVIPETQIQSKDPLSYQQRVREHVAAIGNPASMGTNFGSDVTKLGAFSYNPIGARTREKKYHGLIVDLTKEDSPAQESIDPIKLSQQTQQNVDATKTNKAAAKTSIPDLLAHSQRSEKVTTTEESSLGTSQSMKRKYEDISTLTTEETESWASQSKQQNSDSLQDAQPRDVDMSIPDSQDTTTEAMMEQFTNAEGPARKKAKRSFLQTAGTVLASAVVTGVASIVLLANTPYVGSMS